LLRSLTEKYHSYWLLLWGGIIQSVPCNADHFLIYCAPHLSSYHFWCIHQSSLLWLHWRHLAAKQGGTGQEMAAKFCPSVCLSYFKGSLTCCKILQHRAGSFTSPPKEIVLQIFITLKNPSHSAGFEPTNLGSNGKHNNHYTTENDKYDG
jgi:hypothetical protein